MSYFYKTVLGGKNLFVEYCYSSVDNCIKVVEMFVDGKFHRVNWMSNEGRNTLMAELMSDYDETMLGQMDYDSEIDLDRDVPNFEGTYNTLAQAGV